jgi:UTP--glucose-1-phosphate uridylyltransferase
LARIGQGSGDEIQITDGFAALIAEEQVLACRYRGKRYDCGSKLGYYLEATIAFGLRHLEVVDDLATLLKRMK